VSNKTGCASAHPVFLRHLPEELAHRGFEAIGFKALVEPATVAGATIAAAFFIAQLTHGFLLGLGLLLFGAGERINHPRRSEIVRSEIVDCSGTTEINPWEPSLFGASLDALGIGLVAVSLLLAVFAP